MRKEKCKILQVLLCSLSILSVAACGRLEGRQTPGQDGPGRLQTTNTVSVEGNQVNDSPGNESLSSSSSPSSGNVVQGSGGTTNPLDSLSGLSLDWPAFGNNLWGDHLSPDTRLNGTTASNLSEVYDLTLPGTSPGNETYPIEVGGVLYVTTKMADVIAVDAATGKVIWTYTEPTSAYNLPHMNRGVAVWGGLVYVLSSDDYLTALKANTGTVQFRVQVANPALFYFESMAPLAVDGKVIVGSAGGDEGIRGFVAAYDGKSGKKLWQFYTVPERGTSWLPAQGNHGGGAVWTTPTYDASTRTIYFGTGNPSPDYFGESRPGPDPYTDSVLGLNIDTGKLVFDEQEIAHDLWDYDVASPPILFQQNNRLVIGEAGKDGDWYEWDANTGGAVTTPVAFVKEQHSPPTAAGTKEWPGPDGGANYGPSAYNPLQNLVYVAGINGPETIYASPASHDGHSIDLGTRQNPAPTGEWTGTITAINPATGRIAWQRNTTTPPIGGVTVTLGNLVWYGDASGVLTALDARDGHTVWQRQLGGPIGSAPIVYERGGYTYVTVVTGGATSLMTLFPYNGRAHVITFRLR